MSWSKGSVKCTCHVIRSQVTDPRESYRCNYMDIQKSDPITTLFSVLGSPKGRGQGWKCVGSLWRDVGEVGWVILYGMYDLRSLHGSMGSYLLTWSFISISTWQLLGSVVLLRVTVWVIQTHPVSSPSTGFLVDLLRDSSGLWGGSLSSLWSYGFTKKKN